MTQLVPSWSGAGVGATGEVAFLDHAALVPPTHDMPRSYPTSRLWRLLAGLGDSAVFDMVPGSLPVAVASPMTLDDPEVPKDEGDQSLPENTESIFNAIVEGLRAPLTEARGKVSVPAADKETPSVTLRTQDSTGAPQVAAEVSVPTDAAVTGEFCRRAWDLKNQGSRVMRPSSSV